MNGRIKKLLRAAARDRLGRAMTRAEWKAFKRQYNRMPGPTRAGLILAAKERLEPPHPKEVQTTGYLNTERKLN